MSDCPACPPRTTKQNADLKKAVAGAYKPVFYDNNFAYINNPAYDQCYCGDDLKQMQLGDCWVFDVGGQYRTDITPSGSIADSV